MNSAINFIKKIIDSISAKTLDFCFILFVSSYLPDLICFINKLFSNKRLRIICLGSDEIQGEFIYFYMGILKKSWRRERYYLLIKPYITYYPARLFHLPKDLITYITEKGYVKSLFLQGNNVTNIILNKYGKHLKDPRLRYIITEGLFTYYGFLLTKEEALEIGIGSL